MMYLWQWAGCRMLGSLEQSTLLQKVVKTSFSLQGILVKLLVPISNEKSPTFSEKQQTRGFSIFLGDDFSGFGFSPLAILATFSRILRIYSELNAAYFERPFYSSEVLFTKTAYRSTEDSDSILFLRKLKSVVRMAPIICFLLDSTLQHDYF